MTDHDELRALAEAATPGPWDSEYVWQAVRHIVRNCDFVQGADEFSDGDGFGWNYGPRGEGDPAYIAAVSPDVVVGLLDEIAELRAALSVAVDEFRLADAATIIAQHDTASGKPRAGAA